jgi:hypothetical protein
MPTFILILIGCLNADKILDPDSDNADWPADCRSDAGDIHPGAKEVCDAVDNDCDGVIDEGVTTTFYSDADGDGYGDWRFPVEACEAPSQHVPNDGDCDDVDDSIHPDAVEVCDSIDNDCDDLVDDADDHVQREIEVQVFADVDGDGFGDPAAPSIACGEGGGYVEDNSDCDDSDGDVSPAAQEICDNIDNDCDELIDNDDNSTDFSTGAVFYKDEDKDGFGDPGVPVLRCIADIWHIANSDDCDDSSDTVFPGADEVCSDGAVNDCDGAEETARALCALSGPLTAADATARYAGRGGAGLAVGPAGDLDGDGLADLLIGAAYTATSKYAAGEAYILLGPSTGDSTLGGSSTFMTISGDTAGGYLGHALSGVGDINGDGSNDLLVGSYPTSTVYVFTSLSAGAVPAESATFKIVGVAGDAFGWSIAGAGDVNEDGLNDILIGAPHADGYSGAVYLIYGSADVSDAVLDVSVDLEGRGEKWTSTAAGVGASVALVDVVGDGRDDVVIGMYTNVVYVVEASTIGSGPDLDVVATTMDFGTSGESVCSAVANADDMDGDGRDDLLIGDPARSTSQGAAYLFLGGGPISGPNDAYATFETTVAMSGLGITVAGAGDVDGDGFSDLIVGATISNPRDDDEDGRCDVNCDGLAYLFYGPVSGRVDVADADVTIIGGADAWLGRSIAGIGDTNGDGRSDLLIGAPGFNSDGEALLFLGAGY